MSLMYIGLPAMYLLFFSNFNENYILSTDFRKILKNQFCEDPFSGSRTVPCGRRGGQTDGYDEANRHISQFWERA